MERKNKGLKTKLKIVGAVLSRLGEVQPCEQISWLWLLRIELQGILALHLRVKGRKCVFDSVVRAL